MQDFFRRSVLNHTRPVRPFFFVLILKKYFTWDWEILLDAVVDLLCHSRNSDSAHEVLEQNVTKEKVNQRKDLCDVMDNIPYA